MSLEKNSFPNREFTQIIETLGHTLNSIHQETTPKFKNQIKSYPFCIMECLHVLCNGLRKITENDWRETHYYSYLERYFFGLQLLERFAEISENELTDEILLIKSMISYWAVILPNVDGYMTEFLDCFKTKLENKEMMTERKEMIEVLKRYGNFNERIFFI